MDTKDVIERFYHEVWNAHDIAAAAEVCREDLVFKGSLGDESQGLASFLAYIDSVHASLSQYHCEIEEIVSDSEKGFAKMKFSGHHTGEFLGFAPTQQIVSWSGAALFHMADRKISRVWVLGDLHGLHLQLSGEA